MNLCIDIGNTAIKYAFFDGDDIKSDGRGSLDDLEHLCLSSQYDNLAICSSGVKRELLLEQHPYLKEALILNYMTDSPVSLDYDTPETLGMDRLAAAIGANFLFPNQPVMVIDAGTCFTYDLIDAKGVFKGGLISPGIRLRFKSMNDYTANLPLLDANVAKDYIGKNTHSAMISGVINGIAGEINQHISQFMLNDPDLKVIITGGDAKLFESKVNSDIFVALKLVLVGLNRVLRYHANKN